MDEQASQAHRERASFASRFFNRLHRYLTVLRTHWWVLLLTTLLGAGIESLIIWKTPALYMSTGRMIVSLKLSLPSASVYTEELSNFFGTQMALMQSSTVMNRVTARLQSEKPALVPSPVKIQVAISPKTSIFNLRAEGGSPEYVQAYLDSTLEEFVALKKEMRQRASDTTKTLLLEEVRRMADDLRKSKDSLVNFQGSNSVVFLQEQGNSAGGYLGNLTRQRAEIASELQLLKMLTLDQALERQESMSATPTAPQHQPKDGKKEDAQTSAGEDPQVREQRTSKLVGSEAEYLKARQQILVVRQQRKELAEFLRPKHPKILALDEEIGRMENLLEIFRQQSQVQLANRQRTLELQITNLDSEIKVWEVKTVEISKKMSEYQAIKESVTRLQDTYNGLQTTARTLDVDKEISPETVSILEPASTSVLVPAEAGKNASIAGVVGLVLGLCILLWVDRLDDRPSSSSDLMESFDETIMGQIPKIVLKDKSASPQVLQENDERHALVEAYRNLRSSLMFMSSSEKPPKLIVVTSAIPNDGKSTTVANLAITIARAGSKVLLVDGDLRRGVMHKRFGIEAKSGLAEVLADQIPWRDAVKPTQVPNLDLLQRGASPHNSGELFLTLGRRPFLQEVAKDYDYVLFDSAPVMAADDVCNLAPFVDGLLMVIRAEFTSARVARAALDLLYLRKVNVLGLVFNAVRADGSEYYYYKYSDYYTKLPASEKTG